MAHLVEKKDYGFLSDFTRKSRRNLILSSVASLGAALANLTVDDSATLFSIFSIGQVSDGFLYKALILVILYNAAHFIWYFFADSIEHDWAQAAEHFRQTGAEIGLLRNIVSHISAHITQWPDEPPIPFKDAHKIGKNEMVRLNEVFTENLSRAFWRYPAWFQVKRAFTYFFELGAPLVLAAASIVLLAKKLC